jgi:hypothetical protein
MIDEGSRADCAQWPDEVFKRAMLHGFAAELLFSA